MRLFCYRKKLRDFDKKKKNVNKTKTDQVISVIRSKLSMKNIEKIRSGGVTVRLM